MESRLRSIFLRAATLSLACMAAAGCSLLRPGSAAPVADDPSAPVIQPDVTRRDVSPPRIDTEDFEVQAYYGQISVEDFGSTPVYGARLAYHVTEGLFAELSYGQASDVDRTSAEVLFNVNLLGADRDFRFYDLALGYNLLPGEVFIGSRWAFNSALYVVAGAGNTSFHDDDLFTLTFGAGYRVLATDALALHFDVRDHLFDDDIIGRDKTTHNIEFTLGLSWFF
jgi:outer membrane beta-barrel protein